MKKLISLALVCLGLSANLLACSCGLRPVNTTGKTTTTTTTVRR